MLGSESIREALQGAYDLIHGSDEMTGAYLSMQNACNLLEDALRYDASLAELLKKMQDTLYSMEAHRDEIRTARDAVAFEPQELEAAEERLNLLKTLVKKYGGSEAEALAYLERARRELDALHHAEERLEQLGRDYDIRLEAAVEAADRLHNQRRETAARFKSRIQEELAFLDMPHVAFEVAFAKGKLSATGYDQVEFLISANPGEPPKPIRKIASGGELSRIMLAIRNIIADSDAVGTLIFDEIDAGVSGRASEKIGRKLRQVSKGCQVLCVTHAAQIAAQADSHYSITKAVDGGRTYTQVHLLDREARVDALARIMGGAQLTPAILESAREMLEKTED
ncbi:MAG: hypothetical protein LIO46_07890 [Clostridiales bacterium]|nr:hypothetical protein [Clostridiales bacterium]